MMLKILAHVSTVESAQNRAIYFAKRLFRAMDGIGTDDAAISRIFVSRAEIDLGNIKLQYEKLYDKSLSTEIQVRKSNPSAIGKITIKKMLRFVKGS